LGSSLLFTNFFVVDSLTNPVQAISPDIVIPLGQIAPFEVPEGITTFVVGDPKIAEVVVPPGQNKTALIYTKTPGLTNILIWTTRAGAPNNFVLEVQDTKRNEQIVTKVKVLEVFTGNDGELGVDWQDFISFSEGPPTAPFKFGLPTRVNVLEAKINTLVKDRSAKILAEPTIVSLTGKDASFLSGGEYPVLIYERDRINIQWKEYGIRLDLNARVEGTDNIVVNLKPEVSSIDRANSVLLTGSNTSGSAVIPAFNSRKADSTLVLRDGDSVVIAGLLNTTRERVEGKFPLLGDIPVVGHLFKTTEYRDVKSELVFIVTPSILKGNQVVPEQNYGKDAEELKKK